MTVLLKDTAVDVTCFLELSAGGAATGLAYTDVTVTLKKAGGAFASFPVTALTFQELGSGFYEISLEAGDTDTEGLLYLSLSSAGVKTTLLSFNVQPAASVSPAPVPTTIPTTTLYGYIYDVSGSPAASVPVWIKGVTAPSILHPESEGIAITQTSLVYKTDAYGMFSAALFTGSVVEVTIPSINYRRVVTVPATSSNLFDIP